MIIMLTLSLAAAVPSIAEAKQVLSDMTTNPSAVQFRGIRAVGNVVCGEFNAPNEMGGYEGFEPFSYYAKDRWVTGLFYPTVRTPGNIVDTGHLWKSVMAERVATERGVEDLVRFNEARQLATELMAPCRQVPVRRTSTPTEQ